MELHYLWWSNIGYVAMLRGHNWVAVPPWAVHCWCHQASKAPPNWSCWLAWPRAARRSRLQLANNRKHFVAHLPTNWHQWPHTKCCHVNYLSAATIAAITCKEFQKNMSLKQPLRKALFMVGRPHWCIKPKFSSKWNHSFNISPGMERREKVCGCESIDIHTCNVCHILPLLRLAFGSQSEVHIGRWSSVSSKDSLLMLMHLVARPHPSLPSASAETARMYLFTMEICRWCGAFMSTPRAHGHICIYIYNYTHNDTHTHIFIYT